MGMGSRLFLIDDNDSIQRLSMARLDCLLRFDRRETLPQYAGKRIRSAMAILEVSGRRVRTVRHIDYFILPFDVEGRIDEKEWTRGIRIALELMPSVLSEDHPKQVIDARHRFIRIRYGYKSKWKPTGKVEEGIVAAIFSLK